MSKIFSNGNNTECIKYKFNYFNVIAYAQMYLCLKHYLYKYISFHYRSLPGKKKIGDISLFSMNTSLCYMKKKCINFVGLSCQ